MQHILYTINRTANNYQQSQVPVTVYLDKAAYLSVDTLIQVTRLVSERDAILRGFFAYFDNNTKTIIITKGVGIAQHRLIVLEEPVTITVNFNTNQEQELLQYDRVILVMRIDTSASMNYSSTNGCALIDRGSIDFIVTEKENFTYEDPYLYLPICSMTYVGSNTFIIDYERTYKYRHVFENYSIPYLTNIVSIRNPQLMLSNALYNRYRYILNGFAVLWNDRTREVVIEDGVAYIHGYTVHVSKKTETIENLIEMVYNYEQNRGYTITSPTDLLGRQYVYCMQFDNTYTKDNMQYTVYSLHDMNISNWKMWFTIPIAFIEFRPLVGVIVKSVW